MLAPSLPEGFLDRLVYWVEYRPRCPAIVYLADGELEKERLDYGALLERMDTLAVWLMERVASGSRVLLAAHSEVHYLIGLLACLRAGVVAVPTLMTMNGRALERIQAHGEDASACALLADPWILARRERVVVSPDAWIDNIPWLNMEEAYAQGGPLSSRPTRILPPEGNVSRVAYLQYTSGSTSRPKGVMVTFANLAEQLGALERALNHRPGAVVCNWMPLYHDFGLIMCLQALYSGGTVLLMPAIPTVQRPRRWLRAIGDYRAVTSAAPNFMFDRCVERISPDEQTGIDLSGLRHLLNAAEPIQAATLRSFTQHFHACGFRESAWVPAYGLAEATLLASIAASGKGFFVDRFDPDALLERRAVSVCAASSGKELVGCGSPLVGESLHIVDPEAGLPSAAGSIGEVWLASPSVTAGYWERDVETAETFGACIRDAEGGRHYLRTGDLGFMWQGELFIAGRLKDLIIVRGENHYPQDIESTAVRSHPDLEPNAGAAFAIDGASGERLVVVHEVRREVYQRVVPEGLFAAVRHAVAESHGIDPAHIVLLRPGGLPRTSSGKVQRCACRQAWQDSRLPVLAEWGIPGLSSSVQTGCADVLESEVLRICRQLLGTDRVDSRSNLFEFGVDSLKAAEILLAIEERWQVSFDLADFAECSSVALLSEAIRDRRERPLAVSPSLPFFLGDRDDGEDSLPSADSVVSQIEHYVATWEGERRSQGSLLIGRNTGGKNCPLFWVFQGQQEFAALAERLGSEQPVYGMRSGHQVMEYTEANIQLLATRYRREILAACPNGPFILGGNCQGGLIALAIAQQFWRLQQPVALVCLLEWAFQPQPYLGRVALFWGESSRHKNPFFKFHNPEFYWRRAFGACTVDIVSGGHNEFFSGSNLDVLADALMSRFRQSLAVPPLLLPITAFRATYRVLTPLSRLMPDQRYWLKVEIKNLGADAWFASEQGGLRLGNHWLDREQQMVNWLDGVVSLPGVPAGGVVTVNLPVRSPATPGDHLLQLDLVEEGVAWLSERGIDPANFWVSVL